MRYLFIIFFFVVFEKAETQIPIQANFNIGNVIQYGIENLSKKQFFLMLPLTRVRYMDAVCNNGQCLRNIRLVFPQSIQEGDSATLFCLYDLEAEPLYSVKWYRGRYEIFRYLPRESPRIRIFKLPGLHIDMRGSNSNRLTIIDVPKHLGGNYTCEVTADEPVYTTRYVTEYLQVIPNNNSESIENFIKFKKDHGTNGSQSFYFNKFNVIKFISMYVFICLCEMEDIIYFKSI